MNSQDPKDTGFVLIGSTDFQDSEEHTREEIARLEEHLKTVATPPRSPWGQVLVMILRWIAVIPGALLAVVIAMFPVHWGILILQYFGRLGATSDADWGGVGDLKFWLAKIPIETLEPVFLSFVSPYVMILASAFIAPNHKPKAAAGMVVFLVLAVLLGAWFIETHSFHFVDGWKMLAFKGLLAVAAIWAALRQVTEKYDTP